MGEFTSNLEAECLSVSKNYIKLKVSCSSSEIDTLPKLPKLFKYNGKLSASQIWSRVQLLLHLGCFLTTTITILYMSGVSRLYNPLERYIFQKVSDFHVPTVKTSRLVSTALFLYNIPQFHDAHTKDCFLVNPFFEMKTNTPPCSLCQNVTGIADFSGLSNDTFRHKYRHNGIPFVVRDAFSNPHNTNELMRVLRQNLVFNGDYSHHKFEIIDKKMSFAARKLFPAPYFVPHQSELNLQQFVFIDGPYSSTYQLPFTMFGNVILTQARGRRLIRLIPTWRCKSTCPSVSVQLEAGNALYYSLYFWRAMSQPAPDQTEADNSSVINVSSFYL